MYPPGACIFMRRLKNKIVARERERVAKAAEHAAQREAKEARREERRAATVRAGGWVLDRKSVV